MLDNAIDMSEFIIITSDSPPSLLNGFGFPRSERAEDVRMKNIPPLDELYVLIRQLLQRNSTEQRRRALQTAISSQLRLLLIYLAQLNCETRVSDVTLKETSERATSMEENDASCSQQRCCVATIGTQTSSRGENQSQEKSAHQLPTLSDKFQFHTESASDTIDSYMNETDSSPSFEITQDDIKDQLSSAQKGSGRLESLSHSGEPVPQGSRHPV